ncbi:MAG: DUF3251 domain-containing protein [Symbiopectobacterium sp.]
MLESNIGKLSISLSHIEPEANGTLGAVARSTTGRCNTACVSRPTRLGSVSSIRSVASRCQAKLTPRRLC